ncbi:CHAT domain-containing protein [Chlorogloeopsis sp. ULAP01]|uniref:cell division protein HetF n=1 Tax=Chlorogloeopsis sp. ULAP01 TaxID=3056483 RepID=UPI0025AAFE79|nr:cell division protein HetF [Chlorogloeopsis sp. ULAP01]MDM9384343.1 CHAT domain-containing protein [Chlorogloeopsis sp. ULAP01]
MEFHLSVTPVGQSDYLVRTEQVAPGVPLAEELVTWPVADWLTAAGHLMNDPLKSMLQGDAIALNSVNLVALGQQLYNTLFQGTLRDSWITAQGIAQNHQQVLRLRLGLKDTRLARLPWEVMHAGDRPIATGPYIAFSRYQSGMNGVSRLPSTNMPIPLEEGGIRVLMIISSPTDQVRLDLLKQEAIKLQEELHRQSPRISETGHFLPRIELTLLEQPGREELTQALEQGRFHVLHYSGHSNVGANGGEIYLVSRRTGLTEVLSGDDLAGLLVNNNIQIAVFNSCLGAYPATVNLQGETGERNLTESLVRRGIRGVLAMSERIPDEVALTLTQLFYRNLAQGYPVDLCVSRVRQGLISAYGSHQIYWALPILYLQREFDGYLNPEIYLPQMGQFYNDYDSALSSTSTIFLTRADDADMPLPIDEIMPSGLVDDSCDWLGEDTWGDLVDEIEYDDPGYAEDSAIVSDLLRQLEQSTVANEETAIAPEVVQQVGEDNIDNQEVSGQATSPDHNLSSNLRAELPEETAQDSQVGAERQALVNDANLTRDLRNAFPSSVNFIPPQKPNFRQRAQRRFWSRVGIVGVSAIAAVIGLSVWNSHQKSQLPDLPLTPTVQSQTNPNVSERNLKTEETGIVTAYAIEKVSKGELQKGLLAVEELLNRNALSNAKAALALVPNNNIEDPSVNFLKGRLAWQSVQTGDKNYSIDDARRYWESAVKAEPDSLLYANALGFAYYAEGNINRANDAWFKALNAAIKQQNTSASAIAPTPKEINHDALTAYAGLAIGLYKSALNQPVSKRERYFNEAIKLRQMVVKDDPSHFQINKLANNWLWPQKAVKDWNSLLQLPSSPSQEGES